MLKISSIETETELLLVLEGKLVASWTDELKRVVEGKGKGINRPKLTIDVKEVTEISADGEEALLYCLSHGAKFQGGGVYMKQVLKELAGRIRRKNKG